MRRRNVSFRKHSKKFNRGSRRTRSVNNPSMISRGGFRF